MRFRFQARRGSRSKYRIDHRHDGVSATIGALIDYQIQARREITERHRPGDVMRFSFDPEEEEEKRPLTGRRPSDRLVLTKLLNASESVGIIAHRLCFHRPETQS